MYFLSQMFLPFNAIIYLAYCDEQGNMAEWTPVETQPKESETCFYIVLTGAKYVTLKWTQQTLEEGRVLNYLLG